MRARLSPRLVAALLGVAGALSLLDAAWIHAKAIVAQVLLVQAWEATRANGEAHRPWPWADSHPVARLRAPAHGVAQIVLAGDSGRTIAFAPGWAEASAAPAGRGTTVISAHRDTHFAWLAEVGVGDELVVESSDGERRYRVRETRIVDSRTHRLALDDERDRLLLVTCWPFDAISSGGPLRWVVVAEAAG